MLFLCLRRRETHRRHKTQYQFLPWPSDLRPLQGLPKGQCYCGYFPRGLAGNLFLFCLFGTYHIRIPVCGGLLGAQSLQDRRGHFLRIPFKGKEKGTILQRGPSPFQEISISHSLSPQPSRRQTLLVPHLAGDEADSEGLRKSSRSERKGQGRGGISIQVCLNPKLLHNTSGWANRKPCV